MELLLVIVLAALVMLAVAVVGWLDAGVARPLLPLLSLLNPARRRPCEPESSKCSKQRLSGTATRYLPQRLGAPSCGTV